MVARLEERGHISPDLPISRYISLYLPIWAVARLEKRTFASITPDYY